MAELVKQGLKQAQVPGKVTERDIELPAEVMPHYFLYWLDLRTGKGVLFGAASGRAAEEE